MSSIQNEAQGYFQTYLAPPLAASAAIIAAYPDLAKKSALQQDLSIPKIGVQKALKQGVELIPTVGLLIGAQMVMQKHLEKHFTEEKAEKTFYNTLKSKCQSSFIVGFFSSPILAVLNAQTMNMSLKSIAKTFTPKVIGKLVPAITLQETAFIVGVSGADEVAVEAKKVFGDNQLVEWSCNFFSGAVGSLVGHPANTMLTRWQNGMNIRVGGLMQGSLYKARGCGLFSLVYKVAMKALSSQDSKE